MSRGWTIPEAYTSRPSDLDICPECGGPKTKHGSMCIACRRRIGRATRPASVRFWEKVTIGRPDECWPWTGATGWGGYGAFQWANGDVRTSSRVAWQLERGDIPDGMHVLHRCDNPPCVNPSHLWLGTHADNMADMGHKGRQHKQRKSS